jgi:hypothetical protein
MIRSFFINRSGRRAWFASPIESGDSFPISQSLPDLLSLNVSRDPNRADCSQDKDAFTSLVMFLRTPVYQKETVFLNSSFSNVYKAFVRYKTSLTASWLYFNCLKIINVVRILRHVTYTIQGCSPVGRV